MLLPLLASLVISTGSHAEVEQTLTEGLRTRLAAGWTIADMRTENDEYVVTLTRDDRVEAHVLSDADKATYRIETDAQVPADPREPSEEIVRALAAPRGGLEISMGCGEYYERAYVLQASGTRDVARRLVAWTLATAEDLRMVSVWDQHALFVIERDGQRMDLHAWLDPKGNVLEAQLRRYDEVNDGTATYRRGPAMKRALLRRSVVAITNDDGKIVLGTGKGSFALDPDGDAFAYPQSEEHEGCGC